MPKPNQIGQVADVVDVGPPMERCQCSSAHRRVLVRRLGHFKFDQIAEQRPELADYTPWIAQVWSIVARVSSFGFGSKSRSRILILGLV